MWNVAPDWQLKVGLGKHLKFPEQITETTLRSDMIIFSNATRKLLIYEKYHERKIYLVAHKRKCGKDLELSENCKSKSWQTWCHAIEVKCRVFVGKSLSTTLTNNGIKGKKKKKINISEPMGKYHHSGYRLKKLSREWCENKMKTSIWTCDTNDNE